MAKRDRTNTGTQAHPPAPQPSGSGTGNSFFDPGATAAPASAADSPLSYQSDWNNAVFPFELHARERVASDRAMGRRAGADEGDTFRSTTNLIEVRSQVVFGQWLDSLSQSRNKDVISLYQKRLEAAGLLDEGKYLPGILDAETAHALQEAAAQASFGRSNLDQVLADRAAAVAQRKKEGKTSEDAQFRKNEENAFKGSLYQAYENLWGTLPPPGYIEAAAAAGVNQFEFQWREMHKPEFESSPVYQAGRIGNEADLAAKLGALG